MGNREAKSDRLPSRSALASRIRFCANFRNSTWFTVVSLRQVIAFQARQSNRRVRFASVAWDLPRQEPDVEPGFALIEYRGEVNQ
jgi:hypothetical protein